LQFSLLLILFALMPGFAHPNQPSQAEVPSAKKKPPSRTEYAGDQACRS
jgi:hypothetical protein